MSRCSFLLDSDYSPQVSRFSLPSTHIVQMELACSGMHEAYSPAANIGGTCRNDVCSKI